MPLSPAGLLSVSILGIPFFWALGIDQTFWALLLPVLALQIAYSLRSPEGRHPALIFLGASLFYLLSQLLSARNIDHPLRLFTFCRNWAINATGILAFCAIASYSLSNKRRGMLLAATTVTGLFIAILGVLPLLLDLSSPLVFDTPIERFIPDRLKSYPSVAVQFKKALAGADWWLGRLRMRSNSLFSHPTSFGMALLTLIPMQLTAALIGEKKLRPIAWLSIPLSLVGFYLTYTRGAWIALGLGVCLVGILLLARRASPKLLVPALALLGLGLVFWVPTRLSAIPIRLPQQPQIALFNARGTGSLVDRSTIYWESLRQTAEHPWVGWGTQRHSIEGLPYPAGSHSTYLGVLYKHGIIGFGLFCLMLLLLLVRTLTQSLSPSSNREKRIATNLFLVALIATSTHQWLEELDLDSITFMLFWIYAGITLAPSPHSEPTPPSTLTAQGVG
jgi:O-antigen ligase